MRSLLVGTLLLGSLFATDAASQADTTARAGDHSPLSVSIGWVHGHPGHEDPVEWGAAGGWTAKVAAPYLGGQMLALGELSWYRSRRAELGDVRELWTAIGWETALMRVGPFELGGSGNVGAVRWHLPREVNPDETEMAAGISALLRWRPTAVWWGSVELSRRWTFTDPVIRRDAWTVSVGRELRLPPGFGRWLVPERSEDAVPSGPMPLLAALPLPARLSERLAALADVHVASVDALSIQLATGAAPPWSGPWRARVDGAEIVLASPGPLTPDLLPVDPGAVAAMVVTRARGSREAVLDVTSAPLPAGLSASTWGRGANATGDPGPHQLVRPGYNVESLEWGVGGAAGYRRGSLTLRAEGTRHRRWVSQPLVFHRNVLIIDPLERWPLLDLSKGALSAHLSRGDWTWSARAGRSELEDFLLVPGAPRELPTLHLLQHAHVGATRASARDTLGWSLDATDDTVAATPNQLERHFAWRTEDRALRVWWQAARAGLDLELGRRKQSGEPAPSDGEDGRARITGSIRGRVARARVEVESSLLRTDGRWGQLVQASASLPGADWSARTEAYWERVPAATAAPPLWRASARDADLLASWVIGGGVVEVPGEVRRVGLVTTFERTLAIGSVGVSAEIESLDGVLLEEPRVRARGVLVPEAAAPLVVRSGDGTAATVVGRVSWRWSALSGEGSWRVHGLIEGSEAMERAHRALPRHRFLQHVRWRPRGDLDLLASAELTSATRWEGYETDASAEGWLSGRSALQVAIRKRVWDDRVEAGVAILDVTDRSVPHHPLGAAPGLTMIVSGTVRLGSR